MGPCRAQHFQSPGFNKVWLCWCQVPVVSMSVPVDPSCKYDDLACFSAFGDTIQFVGGINKPKLVQCFDR